MSGRWVEIGPAPLLGGQVGLHGHERPVTGRISAIAIDPKDDRHWLAGGALGGVWETENGGNSWRPLTDGEASLAMGALAFAAGRQGVAYAGTGEALPVPAGFPGRGLLRLTKSNDTGAWRVVPVRRPDSSVPFVGLGFSDIKVNPKNDEHLVVATRWRPQPDFLGGREPSYQEDERGIIELTPTSWAQHVPGDATSLVVHPGRFECMYAGVTRSQNLSDAPTVGLFRRADAKCASSGRPPRTEYRRRTKCTADPTGARWTRISGPWDDEACDRAQMLGNPAAWPAFLARVELAIARNPDVVYVSVATRHVVGAEQAREEARGGGRLLGVENGQCLGR
jgi:hypothetical protein